MAAVQSRSKRIVRDNVAHQAIDRVQRVLLVHSVSEGLLDEDLELMTGLQNRNYTVLHITPRPLILILRAVPFRGGQLDYRVQPHTHKFLLQRQPQSPR
jgi:hypothetical protein